MLKIALFVLVLLPSLAFAQENLMKKAAGVGSIVHESYRQDELGNTYKVWTDRDGKFIYLINDIELSKDKFYETYASRIEVKKLELLDNGFLNQKTETVFIPKHRFMGPSKLSEAEIKRRAEQAKKAEENGGFIAFIDPSSPQERDREYLGSMLVTPSNVDSDKDMDTTKQPRIVYVLKNGKGEIEFMNPDGAPSYPLDPKFVQASDLKALIEDLQTGDSLTKPNFYMTLKGDIIAAKDSRVVMKGNALAAHYMNPQPNVSVGFGYGYVPTFNELIKEKMDAKSVAELLEKLSHDGALKITIESADGSSREISISKDDTLEQKDQDAKKQR